MPDRFITYVIHRLPNVDLHNNFHAITPLLENTSQSSEALKEHAPEQVPIQVIVTSKTARFYWEAPLALVTIVMRTKNRPLMVQRALLDIVDQTYSDWQLVVVNDGGDRRVLDEIIATAPENLIDRTTVIHNDTSRGMEAASNQGIGAAASDYVAIHDDDDTWHPDFLATTVDYLEQHPDEVCVVTRTEIVYERNVHGELIEDHRVPFNAEYQAITYYDLLRINRFVPISCLMRRSALDTFGEFREDLPVVGDWEYHMRLAKDRPIPVIDMTLAFWHQRLDDTSTYGNSVNAALLSHRHYDRAVRDEHVRRYVDDHGPGGLMFVVGHADDIHREDLARFDHLQHRIDHLEHELTRLHDTINRQNDLIDSMTHAIREQGVIAFARRQYYRRKQT